MDLLIKLCLLIATSALTLADVQFYVPQLTLTKMLGKVTLTSFVLDQPQCIFNQYPTNDVWLVIALDKVVPDITDTMLSTPSRYALFAQNRTEYYHILRVRGADYPCTDTQTNIYTFLKVGAQVNCTEPTFCNGPLTLFGPYRVKFVILNSTGLVNATRWSEKIPLRTAKPYSDIDTFPAKRSAGMIVITVILSVLLAILLICLIAALIVGSKDICWCREIDNRESIFPDKEPNVFYIMNYKTHHIKYRNM
ncbi:uroplakin-3b-like [Bombina bombina]|uniref:uroplakin-3b-like n=1 Tax=Bombina bombina TaxID=8345 RepID=UPI00235AFD1D|nr:uroplakin-3b-like [Bombina bombina]